MITHENKLSVAPVGEKLTLNLNRYDEDFQLKFVLIAGEGTLNIEDGTTASIRGTKGKGGNYEATATISNGVVTVNGDKNMTDESGKGRFELCLTHDGKKLHTSNFYIIFEDQPVQEETS